MSTTIYLALGSNLGQRAANLRAALALLPPGVKVTRASPVYETDPWGYLDQPAFLNQVIEGETDLSPADLLAHLKQIEATLGRRPTFKNGPRLIDLDVLFYGDQVVVGEGLAIPHPRLHERAFVLVPLADLAPALIHPVLGKSVAELLGAVERGGIRRVMTRLPAFGLRTYVMGILNVTPDSFSGDGLLQSGAPLEQSLQQARAFAAAGADILDVGGESTRPGAQPVSEQEELERVVPVIAALRRELDVLISVDTYKAGVAAAALDAGADWVNDVWGLRADPNLGTVTAERGAPIILMHNRMQPASAELRERLGGRYVGVHYDDLLGDICRELLESVALAKAAGIPEENILLDPGIGFGKTVEQNLELLNRLDEICALGYPVLLGPSRKSFIGYTLNLPPDQRLEGTAAAVSIGIARGADIVRVHDVAAMVRVARMADAITRSRGVRQPLPFAERVRTVSHG